MVLTSEAKAGSLRATPKSIISRLAESPSHGRGSLDMRTLRAGLTCSRVQTFMPE